MDAMLAVTEQDSADLLDRVELIGRNLEFTRSLKALSNSSISHSGVLISGASGIGKTRLSEDLVKHLRASSNPPRTLFVRPSLLRSTKEMPGIGLSDPQMLTLQEPGSANQIHRLLSAPPSRRPLIVVDDAHHLTDDAAGILVEIARRKSALLLLTADMQRAGSESLMSLWKDEYVRRIDLRPLALEDTNNLARQWMDGHNAIHGAQKLALLSGGNPLLLRELIKSALVNDLNFRGAPSPLHADMTLSPALYELTNRLLESLSAGARRALEIISLSEPIPLEIAEEVSDPAALLELEGRSLVSISKATAIGPVSPSSESARLTVMNPLIGCAVRQLQKPLLRRSYLRQLIDSHNARLSLLTHDDHVRLTAWRMEVSPAGVTEEDLLSASRLAQSRGDVQVAAKFSHAAWERSHSIQAASTFARICVSMGNHLAAYNVAEYHSEGDSIQGIAVRGLIFQKQHQRAGRLLTRLSPSEQRICRGMILYLQGDFKSCVDLLSPFLETDCHPSHRFEAGIFVSASLCSLGRPEDSLGVAERLLSSNNGNSGEYFALFAEHLEDVRCMALANLGRLEEAANSLQDHYRRALTSNNPCSDARRGILLGSVLLEIGLPRTALEYLCLSDSYSTGWEFLEQKGWILEDLGRLLLPSDDRIPRTRKEFGQPSTDLGYLSSTSALSLAWREVRDSNFGAACDILLKEARSQMRREAFGEVVRIVHEMGRLGFCQQTSEFWSIPLQGRYLESKMSFTRSIACGDVNQLRRTASSFASLGASLYAAEAYAELSRLYQKLGNDRASTAARQQAAAFSGRCEGAVTPALRMLTEVNHLSSREREIAGLVARGLSDKEIADALILSPRTVGNHLYRIYRKIGVADRRELRARWGKVHL
ncbi:LuxR C-terminal-related transcriptional regulator [Streptomyces sp. NPDC004787]|uniref:LuxR C-terminal-related transcriptional regulator n=1 Tax=Streptomyces sp. NPDC004787 TaxID=3154291 RepID=UPI0033B36DF9